MSKYLHICVIDSTEIPVNDQEFYRVNPYDVQKIVFDEKRFQETFLKVGDFNSVTQEMVDKFIVSVDVTTVGKKTTLVRATLLNGFEIVESSSCVDKKHYKECIGMEECMKKIKDRVWDYLGFMLCSAINGHKLDK